MSGATSGRGPAVVALDLEGTLISNAVSVFPRPGLAPFLEGVRRLADRVVVYTAVSPDAARRIVELLAEEGVAPRWWAEVEIVTSGSVKDLSRIADIGAGTVLLVDDRGDVLPPAQRSHLVHVAEYAPPYGPDDELVVVLQQIAARLGADAAPA